MRLILIYDLPMLEDEDKRIYSIFHRDIIRNGFYMLQYSIYTKVVQNDTKMQQYIIKLNKITPKRGNVIIFKITEKQFQDMIYLNGTRNRFESIVGGKELVIFGGEENN